jgi:hypothetical protein
MLVRFATRCEDFLGQIFGKFRVPSRVCEGALHKRNCGSEGRSIASAKGTSGEMRLEGCTRPFREFSVVPS